MRCSSMPSPRLSACAMPAAPRHTSSAPNGSYMRPSSDRRRECENESGMQDEIMRTALASSRECLSVEQVGAYADGTLAGADREAAAGHLAGCLHCQAELALLRAVMTEQIRAEETEIVRDGVARLQPA